LGNSEYELTSYTGHKAEGNNLYIHKMGVFMSVGLVLAALWGWFAYGNNVNPQAGGTMGIFVLAFFATFGGLIFIALAGTDDEFLLGVETILWLPCLINRQIARVGFIMGVLMWQLALKLAEGAMFLSRGPEKWGIYVAEFPQRHELKQVRKEESRKQLQARIKELEEELGVEEAA